MKAGDTLNISATYDTRKASWYESMGIMVAVLRRRHPARRPRTRSRTPIDTHGLLTHGHLPENDNHGGEPRPACRDAREHARRRSLTDERRIKGFVYGRGDFA